MTGLYNMDETEITADFSQRFKFSDWPNAAIPALAAGVYAIWHDDAFMYCGMSGREFEKAQLAQRKKYGLVTRLASHASGRLSGDQFCVYVANRLVLPSLGLDELRKFASGENTLDRLTKAYIHRHFEYQFGVVDSSKRAYELEMRIRSGTVFGVKPLLNPA
ncbi:hypothetical protein B0G69_1543 [Paraburkholderia sp. RAU2J]|uniref:hypothetical protein n=1 Tax=Paraburkholderia sp. RAU2J TaxID=1938810 RepID=UPI000F1FDB2E|nr:hypothetical protein [Paraburkholderia sp. RAU2J]RKT25814.1 hypothetical protein B0G69_1543 [Paraburkholderia sp. RAU2J]